MMAPDPIPAPKGAATRIGSTVAALRALGHEVRLLTPALPGGPASPIDGHDRVGIDLEDELLDRMLSFRSAAAGWLERRSGEVVWFRGTWEGMAAVEWARRRGAKVVFEAHGLPSIELPYHFPGLEAEDDLVGKLIAEENFLLGAADLVLTPSRTGRRNLLSRRVPPERIAVVPNSVDPVLFRPPDPLPADGPPFRLLYQGTLAPWQGLATLLEALGRFRTPGRVELRLAGPAKSAWRSEIRTLSRRFRVRHLVTFLGALEREALAAELAACHVAVAPLPNDPRNSVQGCCPIKILEAMGGGRPILSTRIPPVEELLEGDVEGCLVRPGSPAAMADGLARLFADAAAREEMGRRGRERALRDWTPERFRERLGEAVGRLGRG